MDDNVCVVIAADNPLKRECGVETVISEQNQALDRKTLRICPSAPGLVDSRKLLQVYSIDGKWLPSFLATVDQGYRLTLPWETPMGRLSVRKIKKRFEIQPPLAVWINGSQVLCDLVARACMDMDIPYGVQLHTHYPYYIKARTNSAFLCNMALESQRERSSRVVFNALVKTAPSEWYIREWQNYTGDYDSEFILFPSIVRPFRLMTSEEKEDYRRQFLATHIPPDLWDREIIGGISRVMPEKRIEQAIESHAICVNISRIEGEKPPILVYVGDYESGYKDRLMQLAQFRGTGDLVFFVGGMENALALKFLQIVKVCLLLSLSETQGLVRREAQLANSVPLVTEGTALAEGLLDKRLVLPDDPVEIGRRTYEIVNDQDLFIDIVTTQYTVALRENDPAVYAERFRSFVEKLRKRGDR